MPRRRARPLPADWEEYNHASIRGRHVTRGTELSIRGERGRFRFLKRVVRPALGVEWIDVWGGPKGAPQWRSFHPDRVRRVHRIHTTPENLAAARARDRVRKDPTHAD